MAVVADKDPKLCLYALRSYGGERTFCTAVQSAPAYSLAVSTQWVASASEGGAWELASGEILTHSRHMPKQFTDYCSSMFFFHDFTGSCHDFLRLVKNRPSYWQRCPRSDLHAH